MEIKKIKRALISVYYKDGLEKIVKLLADNNVELLSTGGTQEFIRGLGLQCTAVEDLTGYPSILGGRVKTLHPAVFGGILARRGNDGDKEQLKTYNIGEIDLVIVDLYPFEETVASGASEADIIEKIDIGGISLIRAAAKNFNDVAIVASRSEYGLIEALLQRNNGGTTIDERRDLARRAFAVSSAYDSAIFNWFDAPSPTALRLTANGCRHLRYGENPHQQGRFFGDFDKMFTQLHGKEISYNNILDIDAALSLINDFSEPTVAILKHNNPCGLASGEDLTETWKAALACDPVSAFGGVIVVNRPIDAETAAEIDKIFFEVIVAPEYSPEALAILKHKKNRVILHAHTMQLPATRLRSALNGYLGEDCDVACGLPDDYTIATTDKPTEAMLRDMALANTLVKHFKSNAIVLVKDGKLLGAGMGQVSRIDALKHAITRAKEANRSLQGAVMASDAFFPFSDCVELAWHEGVRGVVQPGGSVRDNETIEFCREKGIPMVMTKIRHFRH